MKRLLILSVIMAVAAMPALSQHKGENVITVSGGYSFAKVEDYDTSATGFRINALYEMNREGEPLAHGAAIGLISLKSSAPASGALIQAADYTITSLPIYYSPKYMFGGETFKGFIRGALGLQFSWFSRTGGKGTITDHDFGFYGGAGAGAMFMVGDNMFINAEYEFAYLSNSFYRDGLMNSAMVGVGFRF